MGPRNRLEAKKRRFFYKESILLRSLISTRDRSLLIADSDSARRKLSNGVLKPSLALVGCSYLIPVCVFIVSLSSFVVLRWFLMVV